MEPVAGVARGGQPAGILVVEDEVHTRARFAAVVAADPGLALAGAVGTLAEASALLAGGGVALVVLDLGLPDGNGVRLIHSLAKSGPDVEVLVISVMGDEASVLTAIEAGAGGYLLKDASDDAIRAAIHEVLEGGAPLSPSIAVHLMRRLQAPPPRGAQAGDALLSPRDVELLRLIAKGLTYEEVGAVLGLRYHTVASYAKALYRKLQVRGRAEAVFEAVQLGLVGGRPSGG